MSQQQQQILFWVSVITGVVIALAAIVTASDTSAGRWARTALTRLLQRIGLAFARSLNRVLKPFEEIPRLFWIVLLLLSTAWSLAGWSFSYRLSPNESWTVVALGIALLSTVVLLVVAVVRPAEEPPRIGASAPALFAGHDAEKLKRIDDLRRQVYGIAGALMKYAHPEWDGATTRWDHIEPLNGLLYRLSGEGEDMTAFVVPHHWQDSDEQVVDSLLVTRLEGLLVYLKTVGLPAPI